MSDVTDSDSASPIKFPCHFTIKAVGKSKGSFEKTTLEIVRQQFPTFSDADYKKRLSRDANYLALTITVFAVNKQQLDDVYQALSHSADVLFIL